MRKVILVASFICFALSAFSQQEAQFTQFMYNKLALNPAYAGSNDVACISCLHRSQWMGFEGAPSSQVLNFNSPFFKKRVGMGVSISHDAIGPTETWGAALSYAYRIPVATGNLAVGLQGSLRGYQVNWDETRATHTGDEDIPTGITRRVLPNFGVGVYFNTDKYYLGISSPALLGNDLSYSTLTSNQDFGVEQMHLYLMMGYVFDLSPNVKLKPAALAKYTRNTPFDLDLNATFIFMDKLWTGLSYRLGGAMDDSLGESIDLLLQYQLTPVLRGGLAYDFTLGKIRNQSSGTFELNLEYCFIPKDDRLTNPRFF